MGWHNVLVTTPAHLSVEQGQMIYKHDDKKLKIPIEDINSVILDSNQTLITGQLLSTLSEHKVCVIVTDSFHTPSSVLQPLYQHSRSLKSFNSQISLSKPQSHKIWKRIIINKITNQSIVCKEILKKDIYAFDRLIRKIKPGDPGNIEAQAARLYFRILFENFKRSDKGDIRNACLNYSYSIVRSMIAREICAYGLHPSLGINHKSELNLFNLADDLFEPFRPVIDSWVIKILDTNILNELNTDIKQDLIKVLQVKCKVREAEFTVQTAVQTAVQTYVKSYISLLESGNLEKLVEINPILPIHIKTLG